MLFDLNGSSEMCVIIDRGSESGDPGFIRAEADSSSSSYTHNPNYNVLVFVLRSLLNKFENYLDPRLNDPSLNMRWLFGSKQDEKNGKYEKAQMATKRDVVSIILSLSQLVWIKCRSGGRGLVREVVFSGNI